MDYLSPPRSTTPLRPHCTTTSCDYHDHHDPDHNDHDDPHNNHVHLHHSTTTSHFHHQSSPIITNHHHHHTLPTPPPPAQSTIVHHLRGVGENLWGLRRWQTQGSRGSLQGQRSGGRKGRLQSLRGRGEQGLDTVGIDRHSACLHTQKGSRVPLESITVMSVLLLLFLLTCR